MHFVNAAIQMWFRPSLLRPVVASHVLCPRGTLTRAGRSPALHLRFLKSRKKRELMRFIAVLNRDGGTLRTIDLDAFSSRMTETLEQAGHSIDVECVAGHDIKAALAKAATSRADIVLAGGGDGTISAAAAALMGKKKALAILPAGTMNLFARGLGIPQSLDAAVQSFAHGEVKPIDMASANGRPFVHQFSVGMHAKMVGVRDKMEFASRLGKMRASIRAALATMLDPPAVESLADDRRRRDFDARHPYRHHQQSVRRRPPALRRPARRRRARHLCDGGERTRPIAAFLPQRGTRALARQSACRDPRRRKSRAEDPVALRAGANASSTANCCRWRPRRPSKFTRER